MYGLLEDGDVKYAIKIPNALSILAHGDPTAEVIGLDQFISGFTFTSSPFTRSKPCGTFINALTIVINTAENEAPMATGTKSNKCLRGLSKRSHVYKYFQKI